MSKATTIYDANQVVMLLRAEGPIEIYSVDFVSCIGSIDRKHSDDPDLLEVIARAFTLGLDRGQRQGRAIMRFEIKTALGLAEGAI